MGFFGKMIDGAAFVGQFAFPEGAFGISGGQWKSGFAAAKALVNGETQDAYAGGAGLITKTALEYMNPGGGRSNIALGEVVEQSVRFWPKIKNFFKDMSFSGMAIGILGIVAIGYLFKDTFKAIFNKFTGGGDKAAPETGASTPEVSVSAKGVEMNGKTVTFDEAKVDQQKLAALGFKIGAEGAPIDIDTKQEVTSANFNAKITENIKDGQIRGVVLSH